jgi:Nucleotidyl transferase AbiEii toxin, Type IV TA system
MSPRPVERLEKTLARVAREQGVAQERLRRWVSFLALCGVLERAVQEGILNNYYLKGGVAMELRFAEGARATKDIDIGLTGERAERLRTFGNALALGFDEFTFQLKGKPLHMDNADAVRLELAVRHRTRAWQSIDIDLGPAGHGVADFVEPAIRGLVEMGLRVPSPVRCLNLNDQVAQKLHACTGPFSKGRARDVLDILLIELFGRLDRAAVREASIRLFAERATHDFPPAVRIPTEWGPELEGLATELGYPATSPAEIESRFRALINALASGG